VTTLLPVTLFSSAVLALAVAAAVRGRRDVPGSTTFVWLMTAIAVWCATGAFHALSDTLAARVLWAKVQYLGIASVPPLWLLFAAAYAQTAALARPRLQQALWIIPVLTMLAAATNEWHLALWPDVRLADNGGTIYGHGWFFWFAATYNYVLILSGTLLMVHALRLSPPPFRAQWFALIGAAAAPWVGNGIYLAGLAPTGVDLTPIAFTISGVLFVQGMYRSQLFDLVPVARDVVVESISDAVIVLDGSRRVLDMNAAARALAGNPARWVGEPVSALIPLLKELRLDVVADSSTTVAHQLGPRDTRYYDLRVIQVRNRRQNPAAAWVVLGRDVTERLRVEAERAALEQRVQEQEKRESLSVLAGGLAHDFNNLLTGIVGNADLLSLQIPPSSEMGSNVGAILLGAQRAADLVDKMLAYAGERHGSIERLDLDVLIRDMIDLLRASAARHCTMTYSGTPTLVDVDPTQVRQVVMNLIINAVDAVDEKSGEIHVVTGVQAMTGNDLATVQCADDAVPGDYAFLEVRDNGSGMDESTLNKIFEPFYTTKPTGHGLGLAAVQGIVHGHRGALWVRSRPGAGTSFRVWLPLATGPAPAPPVTSRGGRHAVEPSAVRRSTSESA
jgi:signal transduction histidine kinase